MDSQIFFLILGMAVVTYLPRALPLLSLKNMKLNPIIKRWLELVPSAVLAALLLPAIVVPDGELILNLSNQYLLASIPTISVGWISRNLPVTIIVGILSMMILNNLLLQLSPGIVIVF